MSQKKGLFPLIQGDLLALPGTETEYRVIVTTTGTFQVPSASRHEFTHELKGENPKKTNRAIALELHTYTSHQIPVSI